jgi:hypothetical protein
LPPERDATKPIEWVVDRPTRILRIEARSTSGRVAHYTLFMPESDAPVKGMP